MSQNLPTWAWLDKAVFDDVTATAEADLKRRTPHLPVTAGIAAAAAILLAGCGSGSDPDEEEIEGGG
ncbi:hypothetical protein ACWGH2_36700 [Streptomyces sp. NPDC054871]